LFYGNAGSDADQIKGDGAMDNKGSTYITFSYNHFWDNGKCSLLGLSEGTTTGLYISYHHNWFDHSDSRHPRVRYYSAHVYNNYYDGNAKYGVGSTLGSSVFVEGNYFRNCKHPMMTSMQGTDVWNTTTLKKDPSNVGTFSGEDGGTIKAFNNTFDASIGTNNMRFVAYADANPAFNIAGVISSITDFDAYLAATRGEIVPTTVKPFQGAITYNNFDTDAALYVKNLIIDEPSIAKDKAMQYAGRVAGGDLKFIFDNAVDDAAYLVNTAIKTAITNYNTSLVSVQGENTTTVSSQTLTSTANNNQTVATGAAIATIVYTWGGDATDATVTGLPASGISFVKDATAKTITISGIPTATVSYSITTTGSAGTPATASGTITVTTGGTTTGDAIHNFTASGTTSTFFSITGNLSTGYGTVTYAGLTLTQCLKLESSTNIAFTTSAASTFTLVFNSIYTGTIKVDGTVFTPTAGKITLNLAAGLHTITKGSGSNYIFYMSVAANVSTIHNTAALAIILFPNPATNNLYISTDVTIEKVNIYSLTGMLIQQSEGNVKTIDISELSTGNYMAKIFTSQGIVIQKIIKK
jgi:pectate lyase